MPLASDLISLGSFRQSFRQIEISNLSNVLYLIDRARMWQKLWSRYLYLIPHTEYIIDKYLRISWIKKMRKRNLNIVCNESEAGEE